MNFLTPNSVSSLTGISESTLARYRCEGNGPAYVKVGRKILYPAAEIQAWLQENTFQSTSGECIFKAEWDELERAA